MEISGKQLNLELGKEVWAGDTNLGVVGIKMGLKACI